MYIFEKSFKNRKKTWRKPYRRSLRFDRSCRNHGSCGYCKDNRTYFDRKWRFGLENELKTFKNDVISTVHKLDLEIQKEIEDWYDGYDYSYFNGYDFDELNQTMKKSEKSA